ncbi:hypothetical protein G7046_g4255 [Stylonectria norvegica]|nr:hypothetical protein G7046_g4255 [Stylonectria norvegica]
MDGGSGGLQHRLNNPDDGEQLTAHPPRALKSQGPKRNPLCAPQTPDRPGQAQRRTIGRDSVVIVGVAHGSVYLETRKCNNGVECSQTLDFAHDDPAARPTPLLAAPVSRQARRLAASGKRGRVFAALMIELGPRSSSYPHTGSGSGSR